jgi:peptidoglycan/LPS O-acetylase OafA/YrhL
MRRITYLDGLRGLACLQVLFYHFQIFIPMVNLGFMANGQCAVSLFFVLSGFVLTFSFENARVPAATKLLLRWVRLGLPAIASICVAAGVILLLGGNLGSQVSMSSARFILST